MSRNEPRYDLRAIRELLVRAFTAADLQRLCLDHHSLRPIVANFGIKYSLNDMIDEVIDYCETALLWDVFLAAVRDVRPNHFARVEPRLRLAPGAGPSRPVPASTAVGGEPARRFGGLAPPSRRSATAAILFLAAILILLGVVRPIRELVLPALATPTPTEATAAAEMPTLWAIPPTAAGVPPEAVPTGFVAAPQVASVLSAPSPTPAPTRIDPLSTAVVRLDTEALFTGTGREASNLFVDDVVYGRVLVVVPRSILPKRATAVHVLLFPDAALLERTALALRSGWQRAAEGLASDGSSGQDERSVDSGPGSAGVEPAWAYPVMIAGLSGAGFTIEPGGPQRQAVVSGQMARWSWSIWTEVTGTHELILSIATQGPLEAEGTEGLLALGSIPIAVRVGDRVAGEQGEAQAAALSAYETATPWPAPVGPPDEFPAFSLAGRAFLCIGSLSLLAALSLLFVLLALRRHRSRESAVALLEQRLNVELDQETQADIRREIAALLSARWWQWWA